MQNAALSVAGLSLRYERRAVLPMALSDVLREFAVSGMAGNVTMPHKEAVWAACAVKSTLAERTGSVNTFWHEQGALHGHNTDVAGALASIAALRPTGMRGRAAAILGAGGAAAAVLVALELSGCTDIRVAARTPERAQRLGERVGVAVHVSSSAERAAAGASLVINATPLGLHDDAMPIAPEQLDVDCAAFDLVYRVSETRWVRACRTRGLRAEDGLRMLVEQGAEAFRVWFDVEPSLRAMWTALEAREKVAG